MTPGSSPPSSSANLTLLPPSASAPAPIIIPAASPLATTPARASAGGASASVPAGPQQQQRQLQQQASGIALQGVSEVVAGDLVHLARSLSSAWMTKVADQLAAWYRDSVPWQVSESGG
jgi:hypothetical protein